jgi:glycosyltransferase involved in cell wall biosynthesis
MTPRFSIITPTRDRPGWLMSAVASVQAQTFTDWEHIIVDVSDVPARELLPKDRRIRYFHMPPADGPALDFQKALDKARGEIVHPLSDDDTIPPHALATVDANISDADWLVAGTALLNGNGQAFTHRGGSEASVSETASGNYMLGGAVYWKRTLSDELGGFDPAYDGAADFDLYRRFIRHGYPVVIGDTLYLYTDHAGTDSRVREANQTAAADRVRRGVTA